MKWVDPRLKWNPDDWNNVTEFRINPDLIWIPDIAPYDGEQLRVNLITMNGNSPDVRSFLKHFEKHVLEQAK